MGKVIPIIDSMDVSATLRRIADQIDSGEIEEDNCTVITGGNLYQMGSDNDRASASDALWNLEWAKMFLMIPTVIETDSDQ
jgi:hypothetical protein